MWQLLNHSPTQSLQWPLTETQGYSTSPYRQFPFVVGAPYKKVFSLMVHPNEGCSLAAGTHQTDLIPSTCLTKNELPVVQNLF